MNFTFFWMLAGFLLVNGCSINPTQPLDKTSAGNVETSRGEPTADASLSRETNDMERLAHLWQKRKQEGFVDDYPIGPGDILQISVPGMEELKDLTVRVSGEGIISLPFVGVVKAAGMTDKAL